MLDQPPVSSPSPRPKPQARVLLEKTGIAVADAERIGLTGTPGTSLELQDLKRVALLPEPMLDKTSFMANGVLAAVQANPGEKDSRKRLDDLVAKLPPFPLSGTRLSESIFSIVRDSDPVMKVLSGQ